MESQNRIGIHLGKDRATVVCLASQGRDKKLLGCFTVTVEETDPQSRQQALADRIAAECKQRRLRFAEASVALDCALFMQHRVHSDFGDAKKIAATVRFDTEEALATDVSEMAVAFRIVSGGDSGATLDVFTAQRSVLSDILMSLQSNGIDPTTVDPDVYCLSRYLGEYGRVEEDQASGTLYALLSDARGYLVGMPAGGDGAATLRAFLVGPTQDRTALVAREALVTAALAADTGPIGNMGVCDAAGRLDAELLAEKVSMPVAACTPAALAGIEPEQIADCGDAIEFVLAYGAALGVAPKDASINLRNDHMPFLGKKMRLQKAVRFLSISVSVLLLAVGIYAHVHLIKVNRNRTQFREKAEPDYLAVMLNKRELPPTMSEALRDVEGELRRVRRGKSGEWTGDATVPARLAQILAALNTCARQIDLRVDSVNVGKNISLVGTTRDRAGTQKLVDALTDAGLRPLPNTADPKDGRITFRVTLNPENTTQ